MIFEDDLKNSLRVLKAGGVILYPTDTIWGLGCDPTNSQSVEKIFAIKSRPDSKSLIIIVNDLSMLERYVKNIPATALSLVNVSDDPITIIYPEGKNLAPGVCSEDGSVGIRICRDEFCIELITRFRKPLISTSANIAGKSAPAHFGEIDNEIISKVDYTVFHKQNDRKKQKASAVIKIEKDGSLKILRM
jgi:L-threonylcarbamoyladenylate synthase